MKIGVEVNSFFGRYGSKTGKMEVEVNPDTNVGKLLEILNIPKDKVGFVVVNQKRVDFEYVFSENDNVYITPFATGG